MGTEKEDHIFFAIIQSQDVDAAEQILEDMNVQYFPLPSVGVFLGKRNATLLINAPLSMQPEIEAALNKTCRQRTEYLAVPLESSPLAMPTPTPITVGGATIFGVETDHYEEF